MATLDQVFSPEGFRQAGHQLIDLLAGHLEAATSGAFDQAIPWRSPDEARTFWATNRESSPLALFETILAQSVRVHHPRYMGHQLSPSAPLAALAGLVGDLLNNGMGVYEMGMAGTAIEQEIIRRLAGKIGWMEGAGGFLTSGGTLANLTALLAARSQKAKADIWTTGNSRQLAVLVSEQAHYCVDRAVRIMGWGEKGILKVPVDDRYRIRTDLLDQYLQQAIADGKEVIAVIGSACSTATGSFDDLEALGQFSRAHGLWFHVDGAHGAALVFSQKHRTVVQGIALADSVVMDFHKMAMVPAITTALVFREGRDSYRTFQQKADYLWAAENEEEWYNLARRTFECTKTMMGLKVFALWQAYGDGLFEDYADRVMENGQLLARLVRQHPHFELALPPQANIVCFRYRTDRVGEDRLSTLNSSIRSSLTEQGRFYIVQTQLNGEVWLRTTLTNPFTTKSDLEGLLDALSEMGRAEVDLIAANR